MCKVLELNQPTCLGLSILKSVHRQVRDKPDILPPSHACLELGGFPESELSVSSAPTKGPTDF